MKLIDLVKNKNAIITSIDIENKELKSRIMDLGIIKGVKIELLRKAPFGDPISYKINDNYNLGLREKEAQEIKIEYLK